MYAALKAGAKIHGEPKVRDSLSGYYSAAVIDFDGNSIEAVYRSGNSVVASEVGGPTIALLENGSVVSKSSKATTIMAAESIASPRSEAKSRAVSKAPTAPSVVSHRSQGPPPSYTTQTVQKTDDGSKAAKTIVGTLIGAAAGAAIAYAMVKGDSQSSSSETTTNPPPQYTPESHQLTAPSQVSHPEEQRQQPSYRAIEAPPSRSVYTSASGPRSTLARSVSSKNPRASTVYDGTEFFLDENGRRASDGSIFSIPEDIPLRAIEYPPPLSNNQDRYPCNPSTFISSYAADKPQPRSLAGAGSVHSASTVKASHASTQRRHSHDDRDTYSSHSHSHSHSHHSQLYRAASSHSQHSLSKPPTKPNDNGSTTSSTRTARQIPLPTGSSATYYSTHSGTPSKACNSSYISARGIPLPESVADLDVDSHVTPDDSISQVGSRSGGRSTHSHSHSHSRRSSHSKAASKASRRSSRSKSRFEEVVKPADSVSQVSRSSQRTVKAAGGGSQAPSKAGSRRGSQVV